MKVKCYRCQQMFSSGEAIRKSQGGYGNTERVWYCFPCYNEMEKEREKSVKRIGLIILSIFLVFLGFYLILGFLGKVFGIGKV